MQCKEHDIWGSAFAVWLGVADEARAKRVAEVFKVNNAELTQKGGCGIHCPAFTGEGL